MSFWTDRSPREQLLVAIAAIILAIFILWLFLVSPILGYKTDAEQTRQVAMRDYDIVAQGLPNLGSTTSDKEAFSRNTLIKEAQSAGIALSRVQPQGEGAVRVWFEDTTSPQVFSFLSSLTERYNTSVTNAQINRRDGGTVSAQFTLRISG